MVVTKQKHELSEELRHFREKEQKAQWFQRRKKQVKRSASNVTSDDSDFSLLSPGSSRATPSDAVHDNFSDSDTEHPSDSSSVFPTCLPVDKQ